MRGAPQVTGFIASLAVAIILENLAVMTISAQPRTFLVPAYLNPLVAFGALSRPGHRHRHRRRSRSC